MTTVYKIILLFISIWENPYPEDALTVANFFASNEANAYVQLGQLEWSKGTEQEVIAWDWAMSDIVIKCVELYYSDTQFCGNDGKCITPWDMWHKNPKDVKIRGGLVAGIKYQMQKEREKGLNK